MIGRRSAEDRFLLFAQARSGSTNLARALDCHPGVSCCHEPFNLGAARGLRLAVETPGDLPNALERVWKRHDGIKHVWLFTGWPFDRESTLNRELLLNAAPRVIFLTRRNILRQAVSDQLALQTGVFNRGDARSRVDLSAFTYRPLDVDAIRTALARAPAAITAHRDALRASGLAARELDYEELYDPDADIGTRRDTVLDLLGFLGRHSVPRKFDRRRLNELLDPTRSRVNSRETLRRVPQIEDIERRLGSDETGWIFR